MLVKIIYLDKELIGDVDTSREAGRKLARFLEFYAKDTSYECGIGFLPL